MKTRNLSHRFADELAIPRVPTWQRQAHVASEIRLGRSRVHRRPGVTERRNSGRLDRSQPPAPRVSAQALLRHGGDPRSGMRRSAA